MNIIEKLLMSNSANNRLLAVSLIDKKFLSSKESLCYGKVYKYNNIEIIVTKDYISFDLNKISYLNIIKDETIYRHTGNEWILDSVLFYKFYNL